MKTDVDSLAEAVEAELLEYSQDVTDDVKRSVTEAARYCKEQIVKNAPVATGRYKRGWRVVKAYESKDDIRFTVHNKTDYQKAHLLEHGHAKRGGGRVEGIPHIGPAADRAARLLMKKAKVAVKK